MCISTWLSNLKILVWGIRIKDGKRLAGSSQTMQELPVLNILHPQYTPLAFLYKINKSCDIIITGEFL
jgi:hypothetical protein